MTPSQGESQYLQNPPEVRKQLGLWKSPSRAVEPFYIASPSPATNMNYEDFVIQRRHLETPAEEGPDILELGISEAETITTERDGPMKAVTKKNSRWGSKGKSGRGNKWVRFLDVGISCPSDESDDELAFCKPLWTKKTGKQTQQ